MIGYALVLGFLWAFVVFMVSVLTRHLGVTLLAAVAYGLIFAAGGLMWTL